MKNSRISLVSTLMLAIAISVFPQEEPAGSADEKASELRQQAVEYLKETSSQVNQLRTVENRISFQSELANLMWFEDEKEAEKMFSNVTADFVQLLTEYHARAVAYGGEPDDFDGSFFGVLTGGGNPRRDAVKMVYKANGVRQQIAMSMAEHDAQLAYDFVVRTSGIVTDKKLAETFTARDTQLEKVIIGSMAGRDIESSLAFGRKSLKRGFSRELVGLAEKIYRKDPKPAIEFAKDLVDKVKSEADADEEKIRNIYSIIRRGEKASEAKEQEQGPLFDRESITELTELMADNLLKLKEFNGYMLDQYLKVIKEEFPAKAKRIETKFKDEGDKDISAAAAKIADAVSDGPPMPIESAASKREEEELNLMRELNELGTKDLSKEQRAEFISRARRIVGEMNNPTKKLTALTALATQVKILGDQELASEIMREGNALVNPNPKNVLEYTQTWMLIVGYSQVDPEKAFPILEDTIFRLNDTIGAFIKVAEFIDVGSDFVIDGEVQLGSFGGAMIRNLVGTAKSSGSVLSSLSAEDFERTKALAEKFEKPELRVLARFLILRSVLGDGQASAQSPNFIF